MNPESNQRPRPTRRDCLTALTYLYALNIPLLMIVGNGYLSCIPAHTTPLGWGITELAFIGNFALLALAPALLTAVTVFFRRLWLTATVGVVTFGLLNIFIYADSVIYRLWRFHFNSMVLNLLTTPGAADSVTAGRSTVLTSIAVFGAILVTEVALAAALLSVLRRWQWRRLPWCIGGIALSLIMLDKAVYCVGDLHDNVEVMRLKHLLPVYQTLTVRRFATRVLGMKIAPEKRLVVKGGSGSLDYPKAPLTFRPGAPRPNVVVIAIEGARFDMLRAEVMPELTAWSQHNLVFDHNYSTGNATRYGIFGLLYGLDGSYWQSAFAEHDGPVLIKSLKDLGYAMRILCCTDLNYPEFRSTCFINVPEAITDRWPGERVDRDRRMTDAFIQFLDEKRTPFFSFMFYDASHQPYHYPPADAIFDVGHVTDDLNYIKLASNPQDLTLIKHRYENALHYVDEQIHRALQALADRGLMDNTLVFIMGDHGEEFRECGLFGHDSAFDQYQTHTLMAVHLPGESARHIERPTSHMDVPATILTYLGAQNPLTDYTQGMPLLSTNARPYLFIASWDSVAIVESNTTITFGTAAYNGDTTVYDANYTPLPRQRAALAAQHGTLLNALQDMRTFTK